MKERINRPKTLVYRWSDQGSFLVLWQTHFLDFDLSFLFSSLFFNPFFIFGFFFFFFPLFHFSTFLAFICTFLLFVGELQNFFSLFSTLAFQHRHSPSVIETRSNPSYSLKLSFFYTCPLVWRVILGRGSERKIIRLKRGSKWIIFYNSERIVKDGRLSSQT